MIVHGYMRKNFNYSPSIILYLLCKFYGIYIKDINFDNKPSKRRYMGVCNGNNIIYLFGGCAETSRGQNSLYVGSYDCYCDMYYIDMKMDSPKWIEIDLGNNWNGDWPQSRWGHSLDYCNDSIFLIGGRDPNGISLQEIWEYKIETGNWHSKKHHNIPGFCEHASCVYNRFIIIFGGRNESKLYICDTKTHEIYSIKSLNNPETRDCHSMTTINDTIIMYGGANTDNEALNDIYSINASDIINNNKPIWIKLDINLPSFYAHNMLTYNNKLIIIGGKDKLGLKGKVSKHLIIFNDINDLKSFTKYKIDKKYQRYLHKSCIIKTKNNVTYLYVINGCNANIEESNDNFIIYINS